jgi:predicted permease
MSATARIKSFVRNLLRRERAQRDLDDELRSFVELAVDEKRSLGLGEAQARRAVLAEAGGLEHVKERVREVASGALVEQLGQDLAYAGRMLVKNRGFGAVAVVTLALGIGANTAIFTVVDTVVFRPLPYREPGRLVKICELSPGHEACEDNVSLPSLVDLRQQSGVFEQIAADDGSDFSLVVDAGPREVANGAMVTINWLSTLGSQPMLGRDFLAEEQQPGRDRVAILTHAFWRRRFAAAPSVLGKTLRLEGQLFTVIGVLPPNVLRYRGDFLKPLVPAEYPAERSQRNLDVFGRLKPGVTLAQAQADVDAVARRLQQQHPETNKDHRFTLEPLGKYYAMTQAKAEKTLVLILAGVGLVLLIACANVANLLLARAAGRHRECVVRSALGASRGRLIRQLLTENLLLFLCGGVVGTLLARWSVGLLLALAVAAGYVPDRMSVALDARVLAVTVLVSLVTGVLFGLAPALQASKVNLDEALREAGRGASGGVGRLRVRRALIVGELAIALVLLVGVGLLGRSFLELRSFSPGFDPDDVVMTESDIRGPLERSVAYWRGALERVRALPDVESASLTSRPPLHGVRAIGVAIEGRTTSAGDALVAGDVLVDPDYFRTLQIPILQGRAFTEADTASAAPAAIISQSLARRSFGEQPALGRRLRIDASPQSCCAGSTAGGWYEVVGVVGDVQQRNLDEKPALTLYRPYTQLVEHDMYLLARARARAGATRLAAVVASRVAQAGEWSPARTMREVLSESESLRLRRFPLIVFGLFAALALALAAVGIYGVMAYSVAERTREIGIRVALGATRGLVMRQVLLEALKLALAGLVVGAVAATLATRFIATMLFGVRPDDVLTYAGVASVLAAVALLASYLPARRATRVDAMAALRHE